MLFCPECGKLLMPKEENKRPKLVCACGYSVTEKDDLLIEETLGKVEKIEIVDARKEVNTLPKIAQECQKCGNKEAFYWTVQTRAGDEGETRFFQCTKCNNRWREY
ncbi:transcription factor S [Candidatus Woesearchaeota archaeon]|nr:transcription factor S [Candidatus Woesearchaeota archaeon]